MFPYRRKGQLKDARAQFFTPWTMAECMAKMALMDAEAMCIERLKQAVEGNPAAKALTLMTTAFPKEVEWFFFERPLPYAVDKAEPFTVADICCGSGVMLPAAAKQFPRWAIDSGLVQFYGVDIDPPAIPSVTS
jgi:methylase of polypeptide subunit release factors